jgi:hypothetical protein
LASVFFEHLPALLKKGRVSKGLLGFVVTSGPEKGFWVVSLEDRECRRGLTTDSPSVVVEADGIVFAALFSGALQIEKALQSGALSVSGDPLVLTSFAKSIL